MAIGDVNARHLVSRTGIGTPPAEIAKLSKLSQSAAIDALLGGVRTAPTSKLPAWSDGPVLPAAAMMSQMGDRKEFQKFLRARGLELKTWWFDEMLATPSPLTERMTLAWHNHFTSSLRKVRRAELMLKQNLMLRAHALGSFKTLLGAVLHDPAMLIYLDNIRNNAKNPNENLGRELLELFTLGEGNYTEADVKATARALTGWGVNRSNGEFRNAKWKHDTNDKTVLGETGAFDGNALVDLLVEHPACADNIVAKIRGEFITSQASRSETKRLVAVFRKRWFVADVVREVLRSRDFWSADNRGTRIKSPVELLVGTVRTLELRVPDSRVLVRSSKSLGQDIMEPPNVKGWAGGTAWITSNSLLRRSALLARAGKLETKVQDIDSWLGDAFAGEPELQRFENVLLAIPAVQLSPGRDVRSHVQAILNDPAYQLG